MRTARFLIGLAAFGLSCAHAQEVPAPMPAPPDGFDALHASDAERAYYGLPAAPRRTDARGAAAYKAWAAAMSAARHYVAPELRLSLRRHGPERVATQRAAFSSHALSNDPQAAVSTNWTAQALTTYSPSFGAGAFKQVVGLWQLPAVQQAVGTCGGTDMSALWVGIDGANGVSADVLQAGTEGDVACVDGASAQVTYPWFEWYPAYTLEIANFPLMAGSSVFVSVQATSATAGQASFVNLETGAYTSTPISAPAGTRLMGNSVEWVMERPTLANNRLGTLSDFGVVMMCYEVANTVGGTSSFSPGAVGAGQTSLLITMLDSSGETIAETAAMGPTGQAFSVQGPTK